jgi:abortive infection bacteriophage resistance protein
MVVLRNLCAHQSRIWNRKLNYQVINKKYFQRFGVSEAKSQWRIISVLMALVDEINQHNNYSNDVLRLCKQNDEFYKGLIEPTL